MVRALARDGCGSGVRGAAAASEEVGCVIGEEDGRREEGRTASSRKRAGGIFSSYARGARRLSRPHHKSVTLVASRRERSRFVLRRGTCPEGRAKSSLFTRGVTVNSCESYPRFVICRYIDLLLVSSFLYRPLSEGQESSVAGGAFALPSSEWCCRPPKSMSIPS